MAHINWLHFTDLHQRAGQDWRWPNVRQNLFEDLKRLHAKTGYWDLVLFTGDLTQSGQAEEFKRVTEFLARLWREFETLGCSPALLTVPGNHDLAWQDAKDPAVRNFRLWAEADIQDEFWNDSSSPMRQIVDRAFANYAVWREACPFTPQIPSWEGI